MSKNTQTILNPRYIMLKRLTSRNASTNIYIYYIIYIYIYNSTQYALGEKPKLGPISNIHHSSYKCTSQVVE